MDKESPLKTIIFSGGGTGGSATPLLAVAEEILDHNPKSHLVFVGTASGPEKQLVADFGVAGNTLEFVAIAAGKWRRYFSLANLLDPFKIILAFFQSLALLRRYRPQAVISAGSFVSVPLVWAAACLKIPALIHQQDVRPGQVFVIRFAGHGVRMNDLPSPGHHQRTVSEKMDHKISR